MLLGRKPEEFFNRPRMTDPEKLAAMQILASMGHAAFYADANMLALVILKMLLLLRYGLAPEHGFAFSAYGILLAGGLWDFKGAIEFGSSG